MNRRRLSLLGVLALTSAGATPARAQPTVVVLGDATCPSVDMIQAALPATAAPSGWPSQAVTVEAAGDRLFIELGEVPGSRRDIPADKDCSVRAESVAVVIAAWSGALASRPTDSPVLTVAAPGPAMPPTSAPGPALAPKPDHVFELDGGAFYSAVWGHGLGGWVDLGRTPRKGGVGFRAMGAYQSGRDITLEGGSNQVLRFLVGAAMTYDLQYRYFFASGDAGLIGTVTRAEGVGYETNRTASAANIGGVANVRGGVPLGRLRLSLNVRVLGMAHPETVKVQSASPGVGDSASLSAWDLQLGAGLGFRFE